MQTVLASPTVPADGRGTASYRYTLSRTGQAVMPYVTHLENMDTGGKSWGHYHDDWVEAVKDLVERVESDPGYK